MTPIDTMERLNGIVKGVRCKRCGSRILREYEIGEVREYCMSCGGPLNECEPLPLARRQGELW